MAIVRFPVFARIVLAPLPCSSPVEPILHLSAKVTPEDVEKTSAVSLTAPVWVAVAIAWILALVAPGAVRFESFVSKSRPPITSLATMATLALRSFICDVVVFSVTTVNLAFGSDVVVPVPMPT